MKLKIFFTLGLFSICARANPDLEAYAKNFRETLAALVKADTTNPPGNEARAVDIFEKELKAAGIDYAITEFAPGRKNIVARLKGNGNKKPVMLIAHTDVVSTEDQQWTTPPHELTEKDGYLYGRGVYDDLGVAVLDLEAFIALKKSGMTLDRDVILALTGDEESGGRGLRYLLKNHPEMVDAEISLNEGGRPNIDHQAKHAKSADFNKDVNFIYLVVAEKTYQDFTVTAHGQSGHSASPNADNAIYNLARALDRLAQYQPEHRLLPVTRQFFKSVGPIEKGKLGDAMTAIANSTSKLPADALAVLLKYPHFASLLQTSCVPTMIDGGTRANVLPVEASVTVNCRILPDETPADVQKRLVKIINDPKVEVTSIRDFGVGSASVVDPEFLKQVTAAANEVWPGAPVIPSMQPGMTDSRQLREKHVLAYGLTGMAMKSIGSHGADEKIPISSIQPGIDFTYRVLVHMATSQAAEAH